MPKGNTRKIRAFGPDSITDPLAVHAPSRFLRLDSIRSRILAFALMATLLPAGISLGIAYAQNHRVLEAKVTQDLVSQSGQGAGAVGVWLKERLYDLRVFAGSEEVANHLAGFGAPGTPTSGRLHDYLASLHERFGDFERLIVIDKNGRVVATSRSSVGSVALPPDWLQSVRTDSRVIGSPYRDPQTQKAKLIVAVPVRDAGGRLLGALAAELSLAQMHQLLRPFARDSAGVVYVLDSAGATIARSDGVVHASGRRVLPAPSMRRLLKRRGDVLEYANAQQQDVVGTLEKVPQLPWVVVAEIPTDAAYADLLSFRGVALGVVVMLLLVAAAGAWRLGLFIVSPLDRLTRAASEVAAGDLAVDLPPGGAGEVGSLTEVFNHMVSRLRDGRRELDRINETLQLKNAELERLSSTDSLTGLANHRELVQRLDEEGMRFLRNGKVFSVLMADVDRFKEYNDAFGHPAGDEVLKTVAAFLRESTRTVDCVARYGGEEFAIVLPETGLAGALLVAERIRTRIAAGQFVGRRVTLSIGVAEYPTAADSPTAIIAAADLALYRAKGMGRNRVEAEGGAAVESEI